MGVAPRRRTFRAKPMLASRAALKQDRAVTFLPAHARTSPIAFRDGMPVASAPVTHNNRNNASLPRAGD
jgi:hypothetical protein